MSKADELFERLGYEFLDLEFGNLQGQKFHRYEYKKERVLENGIRKQVIWFDLKSNEIYIHNTITIEELQAINEKCKDLRVVRLIF